MKLDKHMKPILQVALDFVDLPRALKVAEEAVTGGVDWIEAGTPLIKAEGLNCIRELKKRFPGKTIVADMKTMDVGRVEVEIAAKSGAGIVAILGHASDETIKESVAAAANYGAKIIIDLIEVKDYVTRAKQVERLGVDYIGLHLPIDDQMKGNITFTRVKEVSSAVKIPVAVAGGINSANAASAIKAGASIVVVGGAITKSEHVAKSVRQIKKAINEKVVIKTKLFDRVTEKNITDALQKVSAANVSDALHRAVPLQDLYPVVPGLKIFGTAVTVRTYPGDWAKPVQAIDKAEPGQVIVIDAGGVAPAVWGELASHSAKQKKLAGVVIYGAIRDVADIRSMKFPAYAKIITAHAGEPKGFGEINVPITIAGTRIFPGDWIFADDDAVMVIAKDKIVETVNRAMDVLERENRVREEIRRGGTLGEITRLLRWEKK
jgi:3-hexulose-6-phosphate synthase/6-phospho-3-hexuloisomerase